MGTVLDGLDTDTTRPIEKITTLPSASVTDINNAFSSFDIVILEPGDYSLGASDTITVPDGKQLLGMRPGVAAEDAPASGFVRFVCTASRAVPMVILSGGGKLAHFACIQQNDLTARSIVEANATTGVSAFQSLVADRRAISEDILVDYDHTTASSGGSGFKASGTCRDIRVTSSNTGGLDEGFVGCEMVASGSPRSYSYFENIFVDQAFKGVRLDADRLLLVHSRTEGCATWSINVNAPDCILRGIRLGDIGVVNSLMVGASATNCSLSDIVVEASVGDISIASGSSGVFSNIRSESSSLIPISWASVATSDAWEGAGVFVVVPYTGNATSRTIVCGFAPRFVLINKEDAGGNALSVFNVGSNNTHVVAVGSNVTNEITGRAANGFTLGTGANTNQNSAPFRAVCYK